MFISRTCNIRLRVFKLLFPALIVCFGSLRAQFPNPSLLNTGTNATGTGIVPLLSNDLSWKAAMTNSLGPYVPAVVVGTYPGWSPSPFANATWICFPHTCSVSPADHSCDALYLNEFYKLTFDLPALNCGQSVSTPSAYCLSLDFMADNCVRQIFVNGVSSYLDTSPNPAWNWGFLINNKVTVSLCNNWVAGTNTILVHVISGANANGGQVGFLAQANQTVNPSIGQPLSATGTQTNVTCFGDNTGAASVTGIGGTAPYTYTWLPTGGNLSSATGLSAGVYSCTIQSNNLCTTVKTFTITQPTALTLNVSASSPSACVNKTITLTGTASGGLPGYTYTWSPGTQPNPYTTTQAMAGSYVYTATAKDANNCLTTQTLQLNFTSMSLTVTQASVCPNGTVVLTASGASSYTWYPGIITTATFAANPAASAVYTVVGAAGSCSGSATASVTVLPVLTLNVSATPPSGCVGSPLLLTALNTASAPATYSWTGGPLGNVWLVSPATAGSHTYIVSGTNMSGCASTGSLVVTVYNPPVITASDTTICPGFPAQLMAGGAATYTWLPSGFIGAIHIVSPLVGTTYTVSGSLSGCTASTTASVSLLPAPAVSISNNDFICSGALLNLVGSGNGSYVWQGPGGFNSALQSPTLNPVFPAGSGFYTLTVMAANTCTAAASVSITVLPLPTPVVSGASVCVGGQATLTASGGTAYSWTGPSGFISNSASPVVAVTNASMGHYTVVITANSCTALAVAQVTDNGLAFPVVSISGNTKGCSNSSFVLQGSGGTSFSWAGPNNFHSTQKDLTLSGPSVSGIYTLTVKNSINCASSGTVQVSSYPLPDGTLIADRITFCVPFCSTVSFLPASVNKAPLVNTVFYTANIPAGNNNTVCIQNAGTYTVSAFFTDTNGCTGNRQLVIVAHPKPNADFEFLPAKPVEGPEPVLFTNSSTGEQLIRWDWFFTNNEQLPISTPNASQVYDTAGSYPVALIVTNAWGCSDTSVKYVDVGHDFSFFIPNAFTPDGDNLNNTFFPKGIGIINYQLEVFDRWGEKVFSSNDFYTGWDGSYKGSPCKTDVYVWKIVLTDVSGKTRQYMGHVTLLGQK